jgi:hypothetical protein
MELIGANIYARAVTLNRAEFLYRRRLVRESIEALQRVKEVLARKRAMRPQAIAIVGDSKFKVESRSLRLRLTTKRDAAA